MVNPPADATGIGATAPHAVATMENWSKSLDLRALAREHGTPLYIVHEQQLRDNVAAYSALVGDAGRILYPVKANPSAEILELLAQLGCGADCAAADEVWGALAAGIPIEKISYNTPALDLSLAEWLLRAGGTVVADSRDGLRELQMRLGRRRFSGRLFVRVNPGGLPGYERAAEIHRLTAHGAANSPFGIPSEDLPEVLAACSVPVTGLHIHVGTQMDNVAAFAAGLEFLHETRDLLERETSHRLTTLNLGGGLGIPFLPDQQFPTIAALAATLRPLLRDGTTYQVEPGNSLVGNAVALLGRIVGLKSMRGRRWGIVDVGTDQLMKITIARWEHEIVDADHRPFPRTGSDALAGPLCFAGDVLLPATQLDHVQRDDPILVRHAGAYCESTSSRFNGRRGPAHLLIRADGSHQLARRAEDTFFEPRIQMHVPAELAAPRLPGEPISAPVVRALQSPYLHTEAAHDEYTFLDARRVGERAYRFQVEPRAAVDFMGWPLAVRIASDAVIVAIGHMLGWRAKAGPMYGTRLALSYESDLEASGTLTCDVVVDALRPLPRRAPGYTGVARFQIDGGKVSGVVSVVVPVRRRTATAAT